MFIIVNIFLLHNFKALNIVGPKSNWMIIILGLPFIEHVSKILSNIKKQAIFLKPCFQHLSTLILQSLQKLIYITHHWIKYRNM